MVLAWCVIGFEIFAPFLVLFGANGAILFCSLALIFHLMLSFVMGMNLFPLTWGATYPAILFLSMNKDLLFQMPQSPLHVFISAWFCLLMLWQLIAWIPTVKLKGKRAIYFFLYEFYMFAIRHPDTGIRYCTVTDSQTSRDQDLPLPWNRRFLDAFWNPEHELKKALRHILNGIRFSGRPVKHSTRIERWLRKAGDLPDHMKVQFQLMEEDSFENNDRDEIAVRRSFG
jgi:hypothetical protein